MMKPTLPKVALFLATILAPVTGLGAQVLETETARLPKGGGIVLGQNFEFQTSNTGTEFALPTSLEFGLTDRLELLMEPVAYTAIRPKEGAHATGVGDLETTLTYLAHREGTGSPAVALAGEIKFPTAKNSLIGSGETDYTGYLIVSKRFGRLDTHANFGYTVLGQPEGASVSNTFNGALAFEYGLGSQSELFAEALGVTSAAPGEAAGSENPVAPELGGSELVGTLGFGTSIGSALFVSLGISYDNTQAVLLRPGFIVKLH
ncbi:MAG TPA: transporter [Gemmatimonadales bacterium]|nr:transporter [Gemmatimonadales bacterium]